MRTDNELLGAWVNHRDDGAFEEITSKYAGMVYAACLRVTRDAGLAQEITQESFLALSREAQNIDRSVSGWLHCVATRKAIDRVRKDSGRSRREQQYLTAQANLQRRPDELLLFELDDAMATLPKDQHDVVASYYLRAMGQERIARQFGLTRRQVRYRLEKGVEALQKHLGVVCASMVGVADLMALAEQARSFEAEMPASLVEIVSRKVTADSATINSLAGATAHTGTITAGLPTTLYALTTVIVLTTVGFVGGVVLWDSESDNRVSASQADIDSPTLPPANSETLQPTAQVDPPPSLDATVATAPQSMFTGLIQWKSGEPLTNCRVELRNTTNETVTAVTDVNGRFETEDLSFTLAHVFVETLIENSRFEYAFFSSIKGNTLHLELDKPTVIHGVVKSRETGLPIPHAELGVLTSFQKYSQDRRLLEFDLATDERGQFAIPLYRKSAYVFARAPGFSQNYVTLKNIETTSTTKPVEIELFTSRYVGGIVVDSTDSPIPGAQIFLGRGGGQSLDSLGDEAADAVTGLDGQFYMKEVPDYAVRVSAHIDGLAPGTAEIPPLGGSVVIQLTGGASLGGIATDGSAPLEEGMARVETAGFWKYETQITDGGVFEFEGLPPGPAILEINDTHKLVELWDGQYSRVDFDSKSDKAVLSGTLYRDGEPFSVSWSRSVSIRIDTWDGRHFARLAGTDHNGRFSFQNLPGGFYIMGVRLSKHRGIKYTTGIINGGDELDIDIEFTPGATVFGRVDGVVPDYRNVVHVFYGEGPLKDMALSVSNFRFNHSRHLENHDLIETDEYRIEQLQPGRYVLMALALPEESVEGVSQSLMDMVSVEVADGDILEIDFELRPWDEASDGLLDY